MLKTLGHLLLGSMFIYGGYHAFIEPGHRVHLVEKAGITPAREATIFNGGVMMVAGAALSLGIMPKLAATILIGSLIPTTLVGHSYWNEDNPATLAQQQIQFFKNMSMLGGLILVLTEKDD
jgi:putative oxidoreductase